MLSDFAKPYIQASVPVLREHGLAISTTFYRNLFTAHPELLNIFNTGNQVQGLQQQSLAAAVFAYAANFENPDALSSVVSRITHKHASLGIKPEHYPIVGRHLLSAIQETLGDAATPELLQAWEEAYWALAKVLMAAESDLYESAGVTDAPLKKMCISKITQESALVKAFSLVPADADAVPNFLPGQYISVAVETPDGYRQMRQYSLSDAPGKSALRISVKRERASVSTPTGQVSSWMHDSLKVGDVIEVSAPFGDFAPNLSGSRPVVLLSAGVGITPMLSALNHAATVNPGLTLYFAHATLSAEHHIHKEDIARARLSMPNLRTYIFYEGLCQSAAPEARAGLMDISVIPAEVLSAADIYLCGPAGFMQAQRKALLAAGVSAAHIHREVFGPDLLDHLV